MMRIDEVLERLQEEDVEVTDHRLATVDNGDSGLRIVYYVYLKGDLMLRVEYMYDLTFVLMTNGRLKGAYESVKWHERVMTNEKETAANDISIEGCLNGILLYGVINHRDEFDENEFELLLKLIKRMIT